MAAGLTTAFASTCSQGFEYSGFESQDTWQGVEGWITKDGFTLSSPSYQHDLAWSGLWSRDPACVNGGVCWVQVGYGIGNIQNQVMTSLTPYAESTDSSGYHFQWITNPVLLQSFRGSSTDFWNDFYSGSQGTPMSNGDPTGVYYGYVYNSLLSSPAHIITADLPNYAGGQTVESNLEIWDYIPQSCPNTPAWEYFGQTGSGLELSPNGSSWQMWGSSTPTSVLAIPNYAMSYSPYYYFQTWGY